MKKALLVMAGLAWLCAAPLPSVADAELRVLTAGPEPRPRTLGVSGRGTLSLEPEIVRISIGVRTEGQDAADAVARNNKRAAEVTRALREGGVPERDLRTTGFSVQPQQRWGPKREDLGTFYVVQNTVAATLRDLQRVGGVLDAAVKAGANAIAGVEFDVADRAGADAQALAAAVRDARRRAEAAATAAGVELGDVLSLDTVLGGGGPRPMVAFERAAASEVPISPGQLEVSAEVTIVYEIR